MLTAANRVKIFRAQTQNLRDITSAYGDIKKTINNDLAESRQVSAGNHTKILAVVFSAWAEVSLSKLIHTPHGFSLTEIAQIKAKWKSSLENAWEETIILGTKKIAIKNQSHFGYKVRTRLLKIVKAYIIQPSLLRNKIAHGQWSVALNRENTETNSNLTSEIGDLNIVVIDRWVSVVTELMRVVETLISSPKKAFHRDYWGIIDEMENKIQEMSRWSLADKVSKLQLKRSRKPPKKVCPVCMAPCKCDL